jgi:Rrf2 family cysteine metabolism transcriptional repressor
MGILELSCKSEYALLALLELAQHYNDGRVLQIREIAAHQVHSRPLPGATVGHLAPAGAGAQPAGGQRGLFSGSTALADFLLDVIQAIEGEELSRSRTLASSDLTPERQVLLQAWQEAQAAAVDILQKTTLQDLCDRQAQGQQARLMYYI